MKKFSSLIKSFTQKFHMPLEQIEKPKNICAYPWQQMIIDLTGEVVPCCFWSGYGNFGKPLGNTNLRTIDEIWNSGPYRELRERTATGDLNGYPCYHCMSYRWSNGKYPPFSWPTSYQKEEGYCYIVPIPERFLDNIQGLTDPVSLLYEDDRELPYRDSVHDDIRREGMGRYSVWGHTLYFSSSDNSDPVTNGRTYELRCAEFNQKLAGLVKGCLSGTNLFVAHREYMAGEKTLKAKPSMISFISTSDCNIECPACSQNDVRVLKIQHRPETEPDVLAHIPYVYQLIWHGGEPFVIKRLRDFIDNYKIADNPNLSFGFTTNGTLLNAAMLEKLEKFPRINASISVDSFKKETYNYIRSGAKFEKVIENTLRAVSTYNAPDRVFVVGMIVLKTNFLELPDNLRFAAQHGIGVNLSPVIICPVHERLDIFQDFKTQTKGWKEAVAETLAVVKEGKARGVKAFSRVDPEYMVSELNNILQRAESRYADSLEITIKLSDPYRSLPKMHKPGILFVLTNNWGNPLSYALFDHGEGEYRLCLPHSELTGDGDLCWYMFHDIGRQQDFIDMDFVVDSAWYSLRVSGWKEMPMEIYLEVPEITSVPRKSNASLSNEGLPTGNGIYMKDLDQIKKAHANRIELERAQGYGLIGEGTRMDIICKRQKLMLASRYRNYRPIR
jgi:MoaA/NifB/PqqE/SkfB family radical SAM enzyme